MVAIDFHNNAVTERITALDPHHQSATARYEQRAQERDKLHSDLAKEGVHSVEKASRVEFRESLLDPSDGLARERIIGDTDLLTINFFDIGLLVARAVCRIQVRDLSGTPLGFGTGFMVSPNLLITNNHVFGSPDDARRSLADFNFEDDVTFLPKAIKTFTFEPDRFFFTDAALDFTLVAVSQRAIDNTPLSNFGYLHLMDVSGKALLNEYVAIIQHPSGASKQVALRENRVIDTFDNFVHYSTDTQPGSSGSPVFNDNWHVVAVHHAGVMKRSAAGKILNKDGKVWKPSMGEEAIAWVANEGVRVSSIFKRLDSQNDWTARQKALLKELRTPPPGFSATMPVALTPRSSGSAPIETEEHDLEWYAGSQGYDPDFLGKRVDLPKLSPRKQKDLAPRKDKKENELKYTNFSVIMSKSRRLAYVTAVNIDGSKLKPIKRDKDTWLFDPRLDKKYQSGPELYARNDLDRGHLVRRLDPVWGSRAAQANEDTFHFTNAAPQHKNLNQQTWQGLEDYILQNADQHNLKVTVFTGPVFRADDMLYRNQFQIPAEFWKVVVMVKPGGKLSATAYLQTQKNLIEDLEFAFGTYKTYQVPVTRIEELTELDFGSLRDFDPLANVEATVIGRVVNTPADIRLY